MRLFIPIFSTGMFVAMAAASAVQADMESLMKANELGALLASEEMCGLTFDQAAIAAWIGANVAPEDMNFAASLNIQVEGQILMFSDMSTSSRTAHCAAVTQTATHYGFLE